MSFTYAQLKTAIQDFTENTEEATDAVKKLSDAFEEMLWKARGAVLEDIEMLPDVQLWTKLLNPDYKTPKLKKPEPLTGEWYDKQEKYQEKFVNSWVNIMDYNFSSFWEKTFGEANSILEQMLMTTLGAVFSSLMSELINFIPGGGIIGFVTSLFNSSVRIGGNNVSSNQPIVIQLGDEDVARVILKGNQIIQQRRLN